MQAITSYYFGEFFGGLAYIESILLALYVFLFVHKKGAVTLICT